jgi:hypothetical protein
MRGHLPRISLPMAARRVWNMHGNSIACFHIAFVAKP